MHAERKEPGPLLLGECSLLPEGVSKGTEGAGPPPPKTTGQEREQKGPESPQSRQKWGLVIPGAARGREAGLALGLRADGPCSQPPA